MESKKSVQNLSNTIHSLLGLKARFTSTWIKSVCDIVRNLPPEGPSIELKYANLKTSDSSGNKDLDGAISKINGKSFLYMYTQMYPYVQQGTPADACKNFTFSQITLHTNMPIIFLFSLTDELAALTSDINQLNTQRKQVLNEFLDLKG